MGRHCGCEVFYFAMAFALGILLMYLSSLKLALFIASVLLVAVCRISLRR